MRATGKKKVRGAWNKFILRTLVSKKVELDYDSRAEEVHGCIKNQHRVNRGGQGKKHLTYLSKLF